MILSTRFCLLISLWLHDFVLRCSLIDLITILSTFFLSDSFSSLSFFFSVCCSVLQCVALMLQCVAVCCVDVAVCCSVLQCVALMLQCVAVCCVDVAVCCSVLRWICLLSFSLTPSPLFFSFSLSVFHQADRWDSKLILKCVAACFMCCSPIDLINTSYPLSLWLLLFLFLSFSLSLLHSAYRWDSKRIWKRVAVCFRVLPCHWSYGVASVSRLDKFLGLFCKRAL